jgi:GcrA cell cycle regulator
MSWTEDQILTLQRLWNEGLSASRIAEELGSVTRNAVIGKAHRLGLASRPSPIKTDGPIRRPGKSKGPSCQWPLGDPSAMDFKFCGAPIEPGRPYCARHCEQAYIRRDNKAA